FSWFDPEAYSRGVQGDASELTLLKWHASCHGTHAALEAIDELAVSHADVDWIEIGVREDLLDVCGIDSPSTPLELKFSLRGVAARRLADIDTSDPMCFNQDTLSSQSWTGALAKIRVVPADLTSDWQTTVTVGTHAGDKVSTTVDLRQPLSPDELR